MKYINDNGVVREMTAEEEAEYDALMEQIAEEEANREPTPEERIQQLEDALVELASMIGG